MWCTVCGKLLVRNSLILKLYRVNQGWPLWTPRYDLERKCSNSTIFVYRLIIHPLPFVTMTVTVSHSWPVYLSQVTRFSYLIYRHISCLSHIVLREERTCRVAPCHMHTCLFFHLKYWREHDTSCLAMKGTSDMYHGLVVSDHFSSVSVRLVSSDVWALINWKYKSKIWKKEYIWTLPVPRELCQDDGVTLTLKSIHCTLQIRICIEKQLLTLHYT